MSDQDLKLLTIEELRDYKTYLIGQIKQLQNKTRQVDKLIKSKLKQSSSEVSNL